jgi:signal transduction histidine kinase/CheY-like chemotaxis protein
LKEEKIYNLFFYPLILEDQPGIVIRFDDITEIVKKEEQLRQAQKMETIGTLAGGLAHDFNNILGGITGCISVMKYKLNSDGEIEKNEQLGLVETMEQSIRRAVLIIQQLLSLSRRQELKFSPVDLNHIIEHIKNICISTFDKSIEMKTEILKNPAMINGNSSQLEQALLNFCINSQHAMTMMRGEDEKKEGLLSISLKEEKLDKKFLESHPEVRGLIYWVLSVKDNGVGMELSTVSKIFEPFYSLKDTGKGSGLGLSMAYNIIKQHDGFIDVFTEKGKGTTFKIYFPKIDETKIEDLKKRKPKIVYGSGTILIVDDEEVMRRMSKIMLMECGYEVILAKNGRDAISKFKDHFNKIDGILLDMAMPKMSGDKTFEELTKIDPHVKVVLTSGNKEDVRVSRVLENGVKDFLQKPFTMAELSKKISDLIKKS